MHNRIMVKREFDKNCDTQRPDPRDPAVVMARIAISALAPQHAQAYRSKSCYNHVVRAIRDGRVHDDDDIVLLGRKGEVLHAAVMRGETPLHDSVAENPGVNVAYSAATGDYGAEKDGREVAYTRIFGMRFQAFKAYYNAERLNIDPNCAYPPYKGDEGQGGGQSRKPRSP